MTRNLKSVKEMTPQEQKAEHLQKMKDIQKHYAKMNSRPTRSKEDDKKLRELMRELYK